MPIKHPNDGESLFNVEETAKGLTDLGLSTSVGTLNSKRTRGDGPAFLKIGKRVFYRSSALSEYVSSKISPEVSSTSQLKTIGGLLMNNKSDKADE
jgi:hypothetical protein